jgi:uncharacterized protein YbjT (DUF2867 family)
MTIVQRNILVTEATGQQGGAVAKLLIQKKHKVYALTRDTKSHAAQELQAKGVKLIKGDLDDANSLYYALKDIESVFLIGTSFEDGYEGEIRRGVLMADAAKEKGIEHLVYSSVANADKNTKVPHFETKFKVEQHIKNLQIPYTIIGPTFFMESLLGQGLRQGNLALPLSSSTVLQQSALDNVAEFSAMVIERRDPYLGKRIDVASDEITGAQIANIISIELGLHIRYLQIPLDRVYEYNDNVARMYDWYETEGTSINISKLHQDYPEINWLTFKSWAEHQNWNEYL